MTRTTTALSNVTETDTCIAPTARRSASINSGNIGPKPTVTNPARLVNRKSLNKKFGLANLMQFTVTVTTSPPRPTSTPRPRRRPNRRRRGPRPPITVTVTAQSPRPTSAPRPDRGNRKKRSTNDEFGLPQPIDPSQPIVTTSETRPQPTSTPHPSRVSKKNRKRFRGNKDE